MSSQSAAATLIARILDGLERVALALRAEGWETAGAARLSPTQHLILRYLAGRTGTPVRLKDVAAHLGVAGPTATDSINALRRKRLVARATHPVDPRAVALTLTAAGTRAAARDERESSATAAALARLASAERADLLLLLVKLIRHLQEADAIAPQRLCVTCRYFRPFAHKGAAAPHHCDYVDAPFGNAELRIDCREHEPADAAGAATAWARFERMLSPNGTAGTGGET